MKTLNIQNKIRRSFILALLAAVPAWTSLAQTATDDQPPSNERAAPLAGHEHDGFEQADWLNRDHLLGDPGGVRSSLEESGILIEATLISDLSKNISGAASKAGTFRHLFDFAVDLDLDRLFEIEGGTVLIDFQTKEGQDGSVETGDLQAYSNIDALDYTAIYEIWYEQLFFDDTARIKVGKIDANADFGYTEFGSEFIHSSPGLSPTGFVTPQYPDPAFGALAFFESDFGGERSAGWYAGAGIFDGAVAEGFRTGIRGPSTLFGDPADLFMIGEAGVTWGDGDAALPGRMGVGVWYHTGGFARFNGGTESRTSGGYIVFDQLLYKENAAADDEQGIGLFGQFGWADENVTAIDRHVGLGAQWVGALPGRDDDITGLMVSWAALSDEPGAGFTENAETAVELFYKLQLTPYFSLKPDLQYIASPGGAGLDDAWVGTLRLELLF